MEAQISAGWAQKGLETELYFFIDTVAKYYSMIISKFAFRVWRKMLRWSDRMDFVPCTGIIADLDPELRLPTGIEPPEWVCMDISFGQRSGFYMSSRRIRKGPSPRDISLHLRHRYSGRAVQVHCINTFEHHPDSGWDI